MPLGAPTTPTLPRPTGGPKPPDRGYGYTPPTTSSNSQSSTPSSSPGQFGGWSTIPAAGTNQVQPGPTAGSYTRATPTDPLLAWYQGAVDLNNAYYMQQVAQNNLNYRGGSGGGGGGGAAAAAAADYARRSLQNDYDRLAADMRMSVAQEDKIGADSQLALNAYSDAQGYQIARRALAQRTLDLANTQANDRYTAAMGAAQLAFDRTTRTTRSDATGRGATLTQGYRDALGEIQRTYNLSAEEAKRVLDNSLAGNQLSYDSTNAGLVNENNQSIRNRAGAQADEALQRAQLTKEREYLQALASDYGIRAEQIEDALRRGSAAAGVNYGRLMAQLANANQGADNDRMAANAALAYQVLQMGGVTASPGNVSSGGYRSGGTPSSASGSSAEATPGGASAPGYRGPIGLPNNRQGLPYNPNLT